MRYDPHAHASPSSTVCHSLPPEGDGGERRSIASPAGVGSRFSGDVDARAFGRPCGARASFNTGLIHPVILAAIVSGVICLAAGLAVGQWRVERVEAAHAAETAALREAQIARVLEAHRRGDVLTNALARAREEAAQKTEELHHALARETAGRDCLAGNALRLLDHAPGLRVSAPTGGAVATDAARVATDTDISQWAARAGGQYAECARRLDALIEWHDPHAHASPSATVWHSLPPEGATPALGLPGGGRGHDMEAE